MRMAKDLAHQTWDILSFKLTSVNHVNKDCDIRGYNAETCRKNANIISNVFMAESAFVYECLLIQKPNFIVLPPMFIMPVGSCPIQRNFC